MRVESYGYGGNVLFGGVAQMAVACQRVDLKHDDQRTYVIRSFLSLAFLRPPKAIFVPGMYFLGFSRYSNCIRH